MLLFRLCTKVAPIGFPVIERGLKRNCYPSWTTKLQRALRCRLSWTLHILVNLGSTASFCCSEKLLGTIWRGRRVHWQRAFLHAQKRHFCTKRITLQSQDDGGKFQEGITSSTLVRCVVLVGLSDTENCSAVSNPVFLRRRRQILHFGFALKATWTNFCLMCENKAQMTV